MFLLNSGFLGSRAKALAYEGVGGSFKDDFGEIPENSSVGVHVCAHMLVCVCFCRAGSLIRPSHGLNHSNGSHHNELEDGAQIYARGHPNKT